MSVALWHAQSFDMGHAFQIAAIVLLLTELGICE